MLRWFLRPVECDDFDNAWERTAMRTSEGYRLRERLAVHEARTEAELGSAVVSSAQVVGVRWWQAKRRRRVA